MPAEADKTALLRRMAEALERLAPPPPRRAPWRFIEHLRGSEGAALDE